jgi:hypothetical protein
MEGETATAPAAAVEPAAAPATAAEEPAKSEPANGDKAAATPEPAQDEKAVVTAESSKEPSADKKEEVAMKSGDDAKSEEKAAEEVVVKSGDDAKTEEEAAADEKGGEKKANRAKKEKSSPSPPARSSGREQRVRKSVDAYDPTADEKEKKELIIPEGKGEKLEDMPRVVANFKNVTWSDPHLKMLHTIVFGRGQKKEFKTHLLQFNGLVYPEGKEEEEQEKLKQKMYKLVLSDLKEVMDLCDINRSAESFPGKKGTPDKEMLCDRFLEWLEKPTASGKKVKGTPAKKVTPAKKSPAIKTDSAKKRGRPKGSGTKDKAPAKKAKGTAKAEVVEDEEDEGINFKIPGTTIEKVREKVKSIVENANREELTVKGVRKILEEWLDTDLSEYKDAVRSLVMEAM